MGNAIVKHYLNVNINNFACQYQWSFKSMFIGVSGDLKIIKIILESFCHDAIFIPKI